MPHPWEAWGQAFLGVSVTILLPSWLLEECIQCLLLCNKLSQAQWLKTIPIYYFTASIGQKSGDGMAGFPVTGLSKLQLRCPAGRISFWNLESLQSLCGYWQNSVPHGCRTKIQPPPPPFFFFFANHQLGASSEGLPATSCDVALPTTWQFAPSSSRGEHLLWLWISPMC